MSKVVNFCFLVRFIVFPFSRLVVARPFPGYRATYLIVLGSLSLLVLNVCAYFPAAGIPRSTIHHASDFCAVTTELGVLGLISGLQRSRVDFR